MSAEEVQQAVEVPAAEVVAEVPAEATEAPAAEAAAEPGRWFCDSN